MNVRRGFALAVAMAAWGYAAGSGWWAARPPAAALPSPSLRAELVAMEPDAAAAKLASWLTEVEPPAAGVQAFVVLHDPHGPPQLELGATPDEGFTPKAPELPWPGLAEALSGEVVAEQTICESFGGQTYRHQIVPLDHRSRRFLVFTTWVPAPRWTAWRWLGLVLGGIAAVWAWWPGAVDEATRRGRSAA